MISSDTASNFPVFGEKVDGQIYEIRPGAYAIIFDDNLAVALVQVGQSYFLPGGGAEQGETAAETIQREIYEECGYEVVVGDCVGTAVDYIFVRSEGKYYEIHSVFCEAKLGRKISRGQEIDHQLVWYPVDQAQQLLARPSQEWIVAEAWIKREA